MSEQNKAVVRRFFRAFAENDQTTLAEVLAPDHTYHHHKLGPVNRETHLRGINALAAAFSDLDVTIEDQIAEGDTVATRLRWRAVHTGNFQGLPPTNKEIEVSGISIERIEDG